MPSYSHANIARKLVFTKAVMYPRYGTYSMRLRLPIVGYGSAGTVCGCYRSKFIVRYLSPTTIFHAREILSLQNCYT